MNFVIKLSIRNILFIFFVGIIFSFLEDESWSSMRTIKEITVIKIAPLAMWWLKSPTLLQKFPKEKSLRNPLVQKSGWSYPNANGICFEIRINRISW